MRTLFTLFLILTLSAIGFAQPQNTLEQRIKYLNSIYNTHKAINFYEDSVMVVSGFRSEEHLAAIDSLKQVDVVLTHRIDTYLNTYGYPEKELYGETANQTPLLILQQSALYDVRKSQTKCLYKAYKKDDLELSRLIGFLESEYEYRFQKTYQSYLQDEPRLKDLMTALEVKPSKL
ncbi:hypothetical protein [Owenweeksia hongkongensis]|uniref:hypothetical protein n=1 Tax=Owenweeksia hongkongensis TaxID=253245 RepID=UPI003A9043D5